MEIGTESRRSLLWFLKRNFSYLVKKSRPKVSDLLKPQFYKGLNEVSPKLPRLSDGGSFRVRQVCDCSNNKDMIKYYIVPYPIPILKKRNDKFNG